MNDLQFFVGNEPAQFDRRKGRFVIEQYRRWRVIASTGVHPYVKSGSHNEPMIEAEDGWVLPSNVFKSKTGGFVGDLDFVDENNKPFGQKLHIIAASIDPGDFDAIIERINKLAESLHSPSSYQSTEYELINTHDPRIQVAHFVCDFCQTAQKYWLLIRATPAKDIISSPGYISTHKPLRGASVALLKRMQERPEQDTMLVDQPFETFDTHENRFIGYALRNIRQQLLKSVGDITAIILEIDAKYEKIKALGGVMKSPDAGRLEAWKAELSDTKKRLVDYEKIVQRWNNEHFLSKAKTRPPTFFIPSDRLTQQHGYRQIYYAFRSYQQKISSLTLELNNSLDVALKEKSLHPSHKLYELWVFLEVYEILTKQLGFQPTGNTMHPLKVAEAHDGHCDLSKSCFTLTILDVTMQLDYDQEQSGYKPDIFLLVSKSGIEFRIALDAKYRKYAKQSLDAHADDVIKYERRAEKTLRNVYELDVFYTAKLKYLDDLKTQASFIVHSDQSVACEYHSDSLARYGAVHCLPSTISHLDNLIKRLLLSHGNVLSTCFSCKRPLKTMKRNAQETWCNVCQDWSRKVWCPNCIEKYGFAKISPSDGDLCRMHRED